MESEKMKTIDDGGAAFPRAYSKDHNDEVHWPQSGMSLRDWFAGQALAGMLARDLCAGTRGNNSLTWAVVRGDPENYSRSVASGAYDIADAMLAARKDKP